MRLRSSSRPDLALPPPGPPLLSLAWGSVAIAGGAVVAGLLVGQVVLLLGSSIGDRSGIDSWATLLATGAAVYVIAAMVGRGVGAPRLLHLVVGAVGPLLLGLAFTLVAPTPLVALLVTVAYAVLAVAGLRHGEATRQASGRAAKA